VTYLASPCCQLARHATEEQTIEKEQWTITGRYMQQLLRIGQKKFVVGIHTNLCISASR